METLTGRKEPIQRFLVIEEGKEILKQWILNNLEFVNLDQVVLKYIDSAKRKF
ncbi:TPA: hypothetical protein ACH6JW_002604 [Enterococcus faecium]